MMDYKRYTDFLKDQHFLRWQLLPDEELEAYWAEFAESNPQLAGELARAVRYLKTTGLNSSRLAAADRGQLMERIRKTIGRQEKRKRMRRIYSRWAVAGCILAVVTGTIILYFSAGNHRTEMSADLLANLCNSANVQLITGGESTSFSEDITLRVDEDGETRVRREGQDDDEYYKTAKGGTTTLVVPYGKRSEITLSDGTKVWVNSGSVLRFPARFTGKTRDIFIDGEIYIEVTENAAKPFCVHASTFNVNVYGTSFNVRSYSGTPATVVLVEGSIALETDRGRNSTSAKLSPGEMAILGKRGVIGKKEVDTGRYTSWKDGYLMFLETPVAEVLKQVGQLYGFSFETEDYPDIRNKRCTGKLVLSENPEDVLSTIAELSGTTYERNGGKIRIRKQGSEEPEK